MTTGAAAAADWLLPNLFPNSKGILLLAGSTETVGPPGLLLVRLAAHKKT